MKIISTRKAIFALLCLATVFQAFADGSFSENGFNYTIMKKDSSSLLLLQEKQKLADHHQQQEASWQKHSRRLTDIVKHNEGVWMSDKVFYIVASLSLL